MKTRIIVSVILLPLLLIVILALPKVFTAILFGALSALAAYELLAGTGYIKQISDHVWEGRYAPIWPDGKKRSRNVYGRTREEAEAKLAALIIQMKAEIAALPSGKVTEYPDGVSPKKKQIAS